MKKQSFTDQTMYEVTSSLRSALYNQSKLTINSVLKSNMGKEFYFVVNSPLIKDPWGDTNKPLTLKRLWADEKGGHLEYINHKGELDYAPVERMQTYDILKVLDIIFGENTWSEGEWRKFRPVERLAS